MEGHTKLEQFKLIELKQIFNNFQRKYGLLFYFKIYTLNKFDLVCLLRNTQCFEECYSNHVVFKIETKRIKLTPQTKKTIYRGERITHVTMHRPDKAIRVSFD